MKNKCTRCNYEWEGKPEAKTCPNCKNTEWNQPRKHGVNATKRRKGS